MNRIIFLILFFLNIFLSLSFSKEPPLEWQNKYNYKEHLTGIWEIKTNSINEKIYFNGYWIGFLNTDFVCQILFTEKLSIKKEELYRVKKYGVNQPSYIVLGTNCKDERFQKKFGTSFDNIFISNEGRLFLFQTKNLDNNNLDFLTPVQIIKKISKEDFLSKFKHKFSN